MGIMVYNGKGGNPWADKQRRRGFWNWKGGGGRKKKDNSFTK